MMMANAGVSVGAGMGMGIFRHGLRLYETATSSAEGHKHVCHRI